jgi:RHS repeat-associated protein
MEMDGSLPDHYDATHIGTRNYELTNHLGNVMAVVTDRLNYNGSYWEAEEVSASDYYPFGMQMPGRKYTVGDSYRYGFNGKENDNEVKGVEGSQQDYGMRIYDPRLGRFLSVDPITNKYPELTPYQFASNRPIVAIDLDGLEACDNPWAHSRGLTNHKCAPIPWQGLKKEIGAQLVIPAIIFAPFAPAAITTLTIRVVTSPSFVAVASASTPAIAKYGPDVANFAYGLFTGDVLEPIPTNTGMESADAGLFIRSIFKMPVKPIGWLKAAGVEAAILTKGTKGGKVAVIGQGMKKVKQVAAGLKDPEVFMPTKGAQEAWSDLLKQYNGKQIPDEVVKGTQMYKENVNWINTVKKEGYDILDTGGGASSTFYNMEKQAVYGTGTKKP